MTLATLLSGAAGVVLADFGAPRWIFGLLLAWPATLGLPSALAFLAVAAVWGRSAPAYGLPGYLAAAAGLAWLAQWAALAAWNRITQRPLRPS